MPEDDPFSAKKLLEIHVFSIDGALGDRSDSPMANLNARARRVATEQRVCNCRVMMQTFTTANNKLYAYTSGTNRINAPRQSNGNIYGHTAWPAKQSFPIVKHERIDGNEIVEIPHGAGNGRRGTTTKTVVLFFGIQSNTYFTCPHAGHTC